MAVSPSATASTSSPRRWGQLQAPADLVVVFDDKDLDGGKLIFGLARTVVISSGGHCAGI